MRKNQKMKISKNRLREIILEELKEAVSQEELEDALVGIQSIRGGYRDGEIPAHPGAPKLTKQAFREEASETAARYAIERIIKEKNLRRWDTISPDQVMPYLAGIREKYRQEYEEYHERYLETLTADHHDDQEEESVASKLSALLGR